MKTKFQLTTWTIFIIFVLCLSLINTNIVLADDAPPTEPPTATEEATEPPTEEATLIPELITETPAPPESDSTEDAPAKDKEAPVEELLSEIPDNTDLVILDENGNSVSLASQEAVAILEEADPIWCPASQAIPTPGANGCTTNQTITGLLTLMRNNPTNFDENGIIYLEKPGGAGFTTPLILDNSATSLGASFNTLRNFNLTIRGGWNGNNPGTFSGDTNFGVSGGNQGYIKIGVSAVTPWVGNITLQDINLNNITNASNPSVAVYTSTGSVTLNDIDVDNADNSESVRITTNSGNINIFDSDATDGDDNYGFNITTTSGTVTLTNVLVDNHSDGDGININAGNGAVTLTNADVTDSDNGDGINVTTTGGAVNMTDIDVDNGDGANGINVTTNSGNISLNNTDVSNQEDGRTGNLSSQSGNINITNGSDFDGDNSGGDFNQGFFASTNTGSITINGSDFTDAEGSGTGTNYNGATLTAPNVFLTNVTANDNDLNGILINTTTAVTLDNVDADNNGTNPSGPGNALGSGVTVIGDGSTIVNVTGGDFTDNERYGIEVINGTLNFITMPTFDNNGLGPYFPGGQDITGPTITPTVQCIIGSWGNAGWCVGLLLRVTWNVDDAESSVSSTSGCGATNIISNTPPTGQIVTCTATSADGTLTSSNSITVYRDITAPTASASRAPAPNANGWNNTDVTVTFSGTDANSGIAFCTAPIVRSANGAGQSASGNCTDVAGNVSSTVTINNINIDKTPPVITLVSRTPANGNGWNTGNVTVQWSCADALSGVVSASVSQTVTTEGANQSATGTCQDRAGNTASNTQTGINIDLTNPVATATKSPGPNANGWNNSDVVVTFTGTDNLSGIASCTPAATVSTEGSNQSRSGTCTDLSGRVSNTATANNINIDKTPPVITLVSRTPANGNGWNNGNVTVQWSCSDALSGVVSASLSQTVTTEGANQSATGTCQDLAGNTASDTQTGINVDKTAPTLNLPATVVVEATGPTGANVNYSALASDNLDPSPTLNCLPASGGIYPLGTTPVTCTATDQAGNTSAPSGFNILVQDTTPPAIDPVANITLGSLNGIGKFVYYASPATSDIVDGAGIATCTPASGFFFPMGETVVTCTAMDAHQNVATMSFIVQINEKIPSIITSSGFFIPATGGSSIKLNCVEPDSFIIRMAGARIIFNNLCGYEAFINSLQLLELPGELPSGSEFIDGYSINISKDGKLVNTLPKNASIVIEFNIPNDQKNADLGVLYWDGAQWTEIAGETENGRFKVDVTAEITNSNTFIFVTK